ncbi:alpha/beta fold hydrolase [Streptomyces sp. TP-A0874]|uniref:alpha/beta fold hydrolase n=1 Tax=Streptomyces sp. TP-A0874 TaxID=549819 RepID=UPI000853C773|nr:alpha/beta fold hydrolase [Streptomyces sp. TP-A0874]
MSRPPSLTLPGCARARRLETARGAFAAHEAVPPDGVARYGSALLLPGFTGSKEDFIALLEPLARAGFRVLAVDGRGQHQSPGPAQEAAYAQDELAQDVLAQAEAVQARDGSPLHLLGHSLGGLIARAAVLRDASPFTSLTLMSSGPGAISASQRARMELLVKALQGMEMEAVWQAMRQMDSEEPEATPGTPTAAPTASQDGLEEFLHRRWLATVPQQLLATGRQLMSEPDRSAELAAVALPKLVLSGVVDYAWPMPQMDEMAARLNARRAVIAGAGHSPNAERPAETAEALARFWRAA